MLIQDPLLSNGLIRRFNMTIQQPKDKIKNGRQERILVNRSVSGGGASKEDITRLTNIVLPDEQSAYVIVSAINFVGESPSALLVIPPKKHGK